ncbi:hypothetical protein DQ244_11420 [Blastococcus sp. TBT05-19]|uniref:hypothetical protein n=1 Tax=Blastococcus sp. TBT05-19 TaxID=2250581 RepID=UPI000DE9211C|nr:hypothetical protein [Blastococcus sp. TBT05-19]RBY90082.1 hypothetical protein DQ244_11420 [Blastococcus sp. TBT05-19]
MTRRPVLPGASELFRRTDAAAAPEVTELPSLPTPASSPALRSAGAARRSADTEQAMPLTLVPGGAESGDDALAAFRGGPAEPVQPAVLQPRVATRGRPARGKAERTKHDEKITVYISADELLALESARLALRAQHGLAADRGRIVREAVSVLLADLTERGEDSVLVRRLRS